MRHWGWLALALVAASSPAWAAKCTFVYSEQVRAEVVRPALARLKALDWENPPLTHVKGDTVELEFDNRRPDLLDCPWIKLVLGDCGRTLLAAYRAFPTPGSPWEALPLPKEH